MILAATGLKREAGIIARAGVVAIAGGGDPARLERLLEAETARARAILSIGIGGALAGDLKPGDWVIGRALISLPTTDVIPAEAGNSAGSSDVAHARDPSFRWDDALVEMPCDDAWVAHLHALLPNARVGPIYADGTMIVDAAAKRALHATTGAIAADMESHVAARVAARHGLPFAILRVISDAADRDLPQAVRVGMKPDGGMAVGAVIGALLRGPRQLPALLRVAIDAERAFRSLLRGYDMLARVGFGLADLGELPLDMA